MSTRSRVGRVNPDGTITSIYVHHDGHPSHTLAILKADYTLERQKLTQLLALGDLSAIASEIGEQHPFDQHTFSNREKYANWCLAYGRDRGESGIDAKESPDMAQFAFLCHDCGAEYAYLMGQGGWSGFKVRHHRLFPLTASELEEA